MSKLGIDYRAATLDQVRLAYIDHLRSIASGHRSHDGIDLIAEKAATERVDRELKLLTLAEKKGQLINVGELEPALQQMMSAFRAELLSRDDKLKAEIDALYGIDLDLDLLNEHTRNAMSHLAEYGGGGGSVDPSTGEGGDATGEADDDGMGA